MKYMLMMFGDGAGLVHEHTADWVAGMIQFMQTFNQRTAEAGELIEARGLADPAKAKSVHLTDGKIVVADGPYADQQHSLAAFWVLEVASEERAVELAGEVAAWAEHVEVREIPDGPPQR